MRGCVRRVGLWVLMLAAVSVAVAQEDSAATAFRRAQELKRGVNLSNWFASGDLSPQHLASAVTESDLASIHAMGFDLVRIGVDPSLVGKHGQLATANPAALAALHKAVDEALAEHLAVTLCVFPNDDYKHGLSSEGGVGELAETWRMLAASFAGTDPEHVFFELINEPEVQDAYRWMGIEARLVEAVRVLTRGTRSLLPVRATAASKTCLQRSRCMIAT